MQYLFVYPLFLLYTNIENKKLVSIHGGKYV